MGTDAPSADAVLRMLLHDLRSPLVALIYNAQILLETPDLPDDTRDLAEDLHLAALQSQRTMNAAIEIRKKLEGTLTPHLVPLDLVPLLADARNAFAKRAAERAQTIGIEAPASATAMLDRDLVKALLEALLDLSLRTAPRDSEILVRVAVGPGGIELQVRDARPADARGAASIASLFAAVAAEALGSELRQEHRGDHHLARVRLSPA